MEQEDFLKRLTVKIETTVKIAKDKEESIRGSGTIYKQDDFPDYVYVFTAMHCIYGENFQYSNSQRYEISKIFVKHKYDNDDCFESFGPFDSSNILLEERDRDVAVLKIPKSKIENIYEHIPKVIIINGINDERDCILRGYPAVCEEKEVDTKKDKSKAHLIPAIFKERYKNGQFEIEAKPFLASVTGREAFEIIQGLSGLEYLSKIQGF